MKRKEILLIIGLFSGVFVTGADSFIISPLLPAISRNLSTSISAVAYGVTAYAIFYALGSPFWGPLGDRFDKKKLLEIGIGIFLIGTLLCGFTFNLTSFYLFRAIAGIGASIFVPNVWAFIGEHFNGITRNKVMGIVMSALSLSIAVGVPLGTTLSQLSNWRMAFWGSALLTIIAMLIIIYLVPTIKHVEQDKIKVSYFNSFVTVWRTPNALVSLLITLFWMIGFYSVYTFLGSYVATQFHLNTAQTGYIFMAYGVSNFIASFLGGSIMSKMGQKRSILVNGVVSILMIAVIVIFKDNIAVFLLALIILALVQGVGVTSLNAYLVNVVPSNRSTVMSFNSSFLYLGLTVGSIIGGLVFEPFGFSAVGVVAIFGLIIAIIITLNLRSAQK